MGQQDLNGLLPDLPGQGDAGAAPQPGSAPATAAAPPPVQRQAAASVDVTPATKALFEKVMLTYIGPMAQIVCADHFATNTGVRALTLALANEIPGAAQQAKFRVEIAQLLNL
jgi:hypothetical protein